MCEELVLEQHWEVKSQSSYEDNREESKLTSTCTHEPFFGKCFDPFILILFFVFPVLLIIVVNSWKGKPVREVFDEIPVFYNLCAFSILCSYYSQRKFSNKTSLIRVVALASAGSGLLYSTTTPDSSKDSNSFFL